VQYNCSAEVFLLKRERNSTHARVFGFRSLRNIKAISILNDIGSKLGNDVKCQ
jgi:hypothetical protein